MDLSQVGSRFGTAPVSATLCVNGDCRTDRVALADTTTNRVVAHPMPSESPANPVVTVTLKLERDGAVLLDTQTDTTLTRVLPNGEGCDPVCISSALVLVGTALQQAPPSA